MKQHIPSRGTCAAAALSLLLALSMAPARAQPVPPVEDLVSDRPDATESALAVPAGTWQLEAGVSWEESGDGETLQVPASLLRGGLTERLELRLGWDGWLRHEAEGGETLEGAGDAELGLKLELLAEGRGRPALALLAATSLPVGEGGLTSHRADPSLLLALARDFGDRVGLGVNAGVAWQTEEDALGDRHTSAAGRYSVAAGFALGDRLGAFVEVFGEQPIDAGDGQASVDGGFTWLVRPLLQIDLAGGVGIHGPAPDRFLTAGIVVRWPR